MAVMALGPRQAAVLAYLEGHQGLTAGELARALGLNAEPYQLLQRLERKALVVAVTALEPSQGRPVARWHPAPPGTVPPPPRLADPDAVRRRREADRVAQRARRARARGPRQASPRAPFLPLAACQDTDPDLFYAPDGERGTDARRRVAAAKAVCAGCPVRCRCLSFALGTRQAYGIWGGLDEDERRVLLRQQRARAS